MVNCFYRYGLSLSDRIDLTFLSWYISIFSHLYLVVHVTRMRSRLVSRQCFGRKSSFISFTFCTFSLKYEMEISRETAWGNLHPLTKYGCVGCVCVWQWLYIGRYNSFCHQVNGQESGLGYTRRLNVL